MGGCLEIRTVHRGHFTLFREEDARSNNAQLTISIPCLKLRTGGFEVSVLLGCGAVSLCDWCLTFRDHHAVSTGSVPITQ